MRTIRLRSYDPRMLPRHPGQVARGLVRLSVAGRLAVGFMFGLTIGLTGCGSLEPVAPFSEPVKDPAKLYMRLVLDRPAVALSIGAEQYKTLRLTATPLDAAGHAMAGLPAPTFISLDTAKVTVNADGLVTAHATTDSVTVIASLTAGLVTHADTAVIMVTDLATPPVLDSVSIHPVPPDTGTWWMPQDDQILNLFLGFFGLIPPPTVNGSGGLVPQLVPRATTAGGEALPGTLPYAYSSLDPGVATVDRRSGALTLHRTGTVHMVVQTNAYGVARADTAAFTVVAPYGHGFLVTSATDPNAVFPAAEIRIAVNGLVSWYLLNPDDPTLTLTVTFDDPTNVGRAPDVLCDGLGPGDYCGVGNVVVPNDLSGLGVGFRIRRFPVPGTYTYHVMPYNITGRIVVGNELN